MQLFLFRLTTLLNAGSIARLITKIMKVLGWDSARETWMGILYIIGCIAIIITAVKVIINIYTHFKNKDEQGGNIN
jgi:hypothetical protein